MEREFDRATRTTRTKVWVHGDGHEAQGVCRQRFFSDAEVEQALRSAGFRLEISAAWNAFKKDTPARGDSR